MRGTLPRTLGTESRHHLDRADDVAALDLLFHWPAAMRRDLVLRGGGDAHAGWPSCFIDYLLAH